MGKKTTTPKPAGDSTTAGTGSKGSTAKGKRNGSGGNNAEEIAPTQKRGGKPGSSAAAGAATGAKPKAFTDQDVALRAYLIAENRHEHGIPGNAEQDWLEAERQLTAESRAASSKLRKS